jgi:hypothetical protein
MSTATLTRSQLDQLQPGDVITTIDGHQLPRQLTVERALDAVNDTGTRGIRVANPLRTATEWVIYPGQVHEAITVERPEPKPKRRATRTVGGVTFTHHEDGAWRTAEPTNSEEAARRAYDQHVADERGRALEAARTARLTPAQRRTLANIRDHGDASRGVSGMSAHGGFSQTVAALVRRGFIVIPTTGPYQLSETGEIALQAAEARA